MYSGCFTILPPNRENCGITRDGRVTYYVANVGMSSQHNGGAHVLMGDGAVKFITDSIEAGDARAGMVYLNGAGNQYQGSKSPYGLWGSLGTRASKENIEEEL